MKRGTYRFTYTGRDFRGWLDGRFTAACGDSLKGYIVGSEGNGMIVIEGEPSDVDALADSIDQHSDITDFDQLKVETNVSGRFSEFAEFAPSDACDRCS